MNYRRLGASGLQVSEISLGTWTTFGGSLSPGDATPIVRRAFELGVNLFDTADVYLRGVAETELGKAIRELPRGELVIATKCMGRMGDGPMARGLSRKHIFDAIDASLRRLQLDHVDLYQFHAPDADAPIEESLQAFEELVRLGKALYIGFSNFDEKPKLADQVVALQKRHDWTRMISSQPRYNLVERHVEQGHTAFCKKNGIGMIVYSPLAQGVLTNKYASGGRPDGSRATGTFAHFMDAQKATTPENLTAAERLGAWCAKRDLDPAAVALAWVLREPTVSSAITGASKVEHIERNVKALEVKLSASEWREVTTLAMPKADAKSSRGAAKGRAGAKRNGVAKPVAGRRKLAKRA